MTYSMICDYVVRVLVERMGFTGLALKMPALVGERLDTYVHGEGGELRAILAQSWPFNGPEMIALSADRT